MVNGLLAAPAGWRSKVFEGDVPGEAEDRLLDPSGRAARRALIAGGLLLALAALVGVSRMLQSQESSPAEGAGLTAPSDANSQALHPSAESGERGELSSFLLLTDPVARSRAFFLELSAASVLELPGLLTSLRELPDAGQRESFERSLAERWATLDPRGALRYFQRFPNADPEGTLSGVVFGTWGRNDPDVALTEAMRREDGPARHAAVEAVILAQCGEDPAGAFDLLNKLPEDACDRLELRTQVLRRWAERDPDAAVAAISDLSFSERGAVSVKLAEGWAEKDPAAALKWVEGLPASDARQEALAGVVESWAEQDPAAAGNYVGEFPPGALRVAMLCSVARGMASADPRQAIAWVDANSFADDRNEALDEVFLEFAATSPRGALELASATADYGSKEIGERILASWLRFSRAEPLAWVSGIEDPELRAQWLPMVLEALSQEDPRLAGEYAIAQIPEDGGKSALAAARKSADPREVLRWSKDIDDPALRQEVMGWAVKHWAELDREDAADYALEAEDPALRGVLWGAVVERWLYEDPHWVSGWLSKAPASDDSDWLYAEVAASWIHFDARSASEWVAGLPFGTARDAAVGSLVEEVAPWDMEGALQWASVLGDEAQRLHTVIRLLEQQAQSDAARALQLLETLSVPPETREALRHHLGGMQRQPSIEPSDI
ncbi:MAG TPA: hypothetical protein VMN36_19775 [Verrucomicrobiales bacterium]|nr:hypothetical protein [Verrucomicrobiales bacterium]